MELKQASRQRAKMKLGLQGPSGSGKTYSALLLAYGISNNWQSIAVIDTENHSADLYAHLGNYNVLNIGEPFTPEKYIEAIKLCERSNIEVIIIDSISHEWEGKGGILDIHGNMAGNSFTNWNKVTPRHNNFIQAILQSTSHIICTIRSKQDYVLQEKNGKMVPEKVGLKGITRDGVDYELTVVLDIDIKHHCNATKDRTNLFNGKPEFTITAETGKQIITWCNSGVVPIESSTKKDISQLVEHCITKQELVELYNSISITEKQTYKDLFNHKASSFIQPIPHNTIINNVNNQSQNGTTTSTITRP